MTVSTTNTRSANNSGSGLIRSVLLPALVPVVALMAAATLQAQVAHVSVGKGPAFLFADTAGNRVHLISAGADANFNGVLDPGEAAPTWSVIDGTTHRVVDSATFDAFLNSYPIRVGVNVSAAEIYLPLGGKVQAFDLQTLKHKRDVSTIPAAAVSFDPTSGLLYLTTRDPGFTGPGMVMAVEPITGTLLGEMETGVNPGMVVSVFDPTSYAPGNFILNEGAFGKGNGSVTYTAGNLDIYKAVNGQSVGGGANFIATRGERAYVVLGGSHQVRIINTLTHRDVAPSPIVTLTSGFDSPRALAFQGDSLLVVATYANDIRRFETATGALRDSITLPGKAESVVVRDSLLFAAIKYTAGTYSPDSVVAVVNLNSGVVTDTIVVGRDPGLLLLDKRGDIHAIGYGTGSADRWWKVIDGTTREVKWSRQLSGALGFPLRAAYDANRDSLYLALSDTLFGFPASASEGAGRAIYHDATATGNLANVTDAGNWLLIHELAKDFAPGPTYIHIVDKGDGHKVGRFRAGDFLTMATPVATDRDGVIRLYALNEGAFGSATSSITLFDYKANAFGNLGDGANHLFANENTVAVTMNGTHEVVLTDPATLAVRRRVPTGTSSLDGPRETLLLPNGQLLTTTYAGDIRLLNDDTVEAVIPVGGKAEGIAMLNNELYVANAFLTGTYTTDSRVAVVSLGVLAVERSGQGAGSASLSESVPNPVRDQAAISFSLARSGAARVSVVAVDGREVATLIDQPMEPGQYTLRFDASTLAAGTYFCTLQTGGKLLTQILKVVR
ncbi:MAG: T9SS type A sorting domain-containing protein [Armatimonadetes bacterium]|nr:T9SS type A sorting domain-containing protein [Armatimonadota bacterium]